MPVQQINSTEKTGGRGFGEEEPVSFDETVRRALVFCDSLTEDFAHHRGLLAELQTRLSGGRLHFAVLGQFNRGKSTFINALLGMKSLPSSVLPLTSVPTLIEYGAAQSCKIRFIDGKNDLIVNNPAEIESTLRQYVAEENNPQNRFSVRDATVTCASELIVNGTVLIDTPGFGSTHLHNTKTTLDLLVECDAALFLLSADPPMTEAEMDFLRNVKERVPRIFFILNKIDLLTEQELDEVDRFIRGLLTRELGFPGDTPLYHTCAIKGIQADGLVDLDDDGWIQSGLEAVKSEVLDFMVREKYFTLSEALQDKYREVMSAVRSQLEKKLEDKLAPFNNTRGDLNKITVAIQSLGLELESHTKKCADEKAALSAKINVWTGENLESYVMSMKKALGVLLSGKYIPIEAASIASTLLPKHANDLGGRLLLSMLEFANKPIRTLALNHALAFSNLQKRYADLLKDSGIAPLSPEKFVEQIDFNAAGRQNAFETEETWPQPQPQVTDIFRKKSARFETIREFYEPLCAEAVSKNISEAAKQVQAQIDVTWDSIYKSTTESYRQLIAYLKQLHKSKQALLEKDEMTAKPEVAFLRDKLKMCKF
jgi:GTP-binding protein EngB required for normal cell division